jgi:hypothetical protein
MVHPNLMVPKYRFSKKNYIQPLRYKVSGKKLTKNHQIKRGELLRLHSSKNSSTSFATWDIKADTIDIKYQNNNHML